MPHSCLRLEASVRRYSSRCFEADATHTHLFDGNFERIVEVLVPQIGEGIVEVVQISPPHILKATTQELAFDHILCGSLTFLCFRLEREREIGEVMHITPPAVLMVFGETSHLSLSQCEACGGQSEWLTIRSRCLSPSRQCFLETGVLVLSNAVFPSVQTIW